MLPLVAAAWSMEGSASACRCLDPLPPRPNGTRTGTSQAKWHGTATLFVRPGGKRPEDPLSASRRGLTYRPGGMVPSLRPSGMVR